MDSCSVSGNADSVCRENRSSYLRCRRKQRIQVVQDGFCEKKRVDFVDGGQTGVCFRERFFLVSSGDTPLLRSWEDGWPTNMEGMLF